VRTTTFTIPLGVEVRSWELVLDLLYIVVTIVFFALAAAYVAGCERLGPRPGPQVSRVEARHDH